MARLDHLAYRVADRWKTAEFFMKTFGYKPQSSLENGEFEIKFKDGTTCNCIVLEPPERINGDVPWVAEIGLPSNVIQTYHMPPEIFISSSEDHDSIVGKWVTGRDGVGGLHHVAVMVDSVEQTMKEWKDKGYAEFSSEDAIKCPDLTQVFTKPSKLLGHIVELIQRGKHGFCRDSVEFLMNSTKDFK